MTYTYRPPETLLDRETSVQADYSKLSFYEKTILGIFFGVVIFVAVAAFITNLKV